MCLNCCGICKYIISVRRRTTSTHRIAHLVCARIGKRDRHGPVDVENSCRFLVGGGGADAVVLTITTKENHEVVDGQVRHADSRALADRNRIWGHNWIIPLTTPVAPSLRRQKRRRIRRQRVLRLQTTDRWLQWRRFGWRCRRLASSTTIPNVIS